MDNRTIDLLIGHSNGVVSGEIGGWKTEKTERLGETPVPRSRYFHAALMGAFVVAAAAVPTIFYMLTVIHYGR